MNKDSQIIVTGAAGFIGSYMVGYLNEQGYENLIIVDDFSEAEKKVNYHSKKFTVKIERVELRSEEHTSELQSHSDLVCRLLLEKKKKKNKKKFNQMIRCA